MAEKKQYIFQTKFFPLEFEGILYNSALYHSRFNPECNTERGFIDSLSIALGGTGGRLFQLQEWSAYSVFLFHDYFLNAFSMAKL